MIASGPSTIQLDDPSVRLVDMDNDGLMDIVQLQLDPAAVTSDNYKSITTWNLRWWRNLSTRFIAPNGFWATTMKFSTSPTTINGIVLYHSYPDGSNLCDGVYTRCITRVEFANAMSKAGSSGISMVDMNGDGLPDLVWEAINNPPSGVLLENATNRIHYYPNLCITSVAHCLARIGGSGLCF